MKTFTELAPKNPKLSIQLLIDGDEPVYVSTFKTDDKTYSRKTKRLSERLLVGYVYDCHTKWSDKNDCVGKREQNSVIAWTKCQK